MFIPAVLTGIALGLSAWVGWLLHENQVQTQMIDALVESNRRLRERK